MQHRQSALAFLMYFTAKMPPFLRSREDAYFARYATQYAAEGRFLSVKRKNERKTRKKSRMERKKTKMQAETLYFFREICYNFFRNGILILSRARMRARE